MWIKIKRKGTQQRQLLLGAWTEVLWTLPGLFCRIFSRDLGTARFPVPGDHEQQQLFQSRPAAGNHSTEARLEWRLEGMGRLFSDSFARAESRTGLRRERHE